MHASLVPPLAVASPLAEVYGRSLASSEMGGDLIDAVVSDDRVEVLLGDVSGHGVGAGVVMAMLKGCVRMRLLRNADLGEVVGDANAVLAELTEPHMFATFVAMRIRAEDDGSGTRLEFALAGHLPLFHFRAATADWVQHPNECLPLGVDGTERFTSGAVRVSRGDVLAVFTDGLMEVQNAGGKELGLEGVEAVLRRSLRPSLETTYNAVMTSIAAHGPRLDDQSLVLVRIV
ncbi:MAG: PP2C family protein-serine/threonine phosphatase [Phycisphaerales bacterium]